MTAPYPPTRPTHLASGQDVTVPARNPFKSTFTYGLVLVLLKMLTAKLVRDGHVPVAMQEILDNTLVEVLWWIIGLGMMLYARWFATQPLGMPGTEKNVTIK